MDKIVDGNPSSYYEPVVNGGNITEDIADKGTTTKYIANNYAGIIQFHKQLSKTGDKLDGVTISAFEYIGKKLNETLLNPDDIDLSGYLSIFDFEIRDNVIWDLNKFILSHANLQWVQDMIMNDFVQLPNISGFYGTTDLRTAKQKWIEEATTDGKVKVQLFFANDSYQTNEVIRKMFWQLDEDFKVKYGDKAKSYGEVGSISERCMRPGVSVKYFTFLEDGLWDKPFTNFNSDNQ